MDAAREDGAMSSFEMGSAGKKSALRIFLGKYFLSRGGDLQTPQFAGLDVLHG